MISRYLISFILAFAITAALTPVAIKVAPKIGAMDIPKDNRRMHKDPVPRFGGIAIYLGLLAPILILSKINSQIIGLVLGAAWLVFVGIIDDIKGIPAKVKLLLQIVGATIPVLFGVKVTGFANFFHAGGGDAPIVFPTIIASIITIIWIVGITNTINLIDGLDGLAAGISGIACLSVAYTAYLTGRQETAIIALAVAGAAFGFIIYNHYPAKIFMGDSGSMMLGYMLATSSLISDSPTKRTALLATVIPIIILALPIFDTAFAICRRVYNHKPIFQADKGHLHHRIMALGFGQRRTVLALYCISGIAGVAGVLWTNHMILGSGVLLFIAACLVIIFLGVGIVDKPAKPEEETAPPQEENK